MSDEVLKRGSDESVTDYMIRLFNNKQLYNLTSEEIAQLLNKELGESNGESKYRKDYAQYKRWRDYFIKKNLDQEVVQKYEELKVEAEKEKIRKQDQKREYRKLIRNQARFEQLRDEIVASVNHLSKVNPLPYPPNVSFNYSNENRHGLVAFSDWHYGMIVDNTINQFNSDIFRKRVKYLVEKVIEYGRTNHISTLHVCQLGDMVSGLIHVSTRVQSNEDLISQITYVSEVLANILHNLSNCFSKIIYYNLCGNHARPGKQEDFSIKENFEYLIPWYLQARLKDEENIEIYTEQDGYYPLSIFNEKIVLVHGQFDKINNTANRLPQMLGYVPSIILMGHIHHNYEMEHGTSTVISNGSLIGPDDYSIQSRLGARPSQKFLVFDKDVGLESTYEIKLDHVN